METQVVTASPHVAKAAKSLMSLNNKETLSKKKIHKNKRKHKLLMPLLMLLRLRNTFNQIRISFLCMNYIN
jgi:hypothetical protein